MSSTIERCLQSLGEILLLHAHRGIRTALGPEGQQRLMGLGQERNRFDQHTLCRGGITRKQGFAASKKRLAQNQIRLRRLQRPRFMAVPVFSGLFGCIDGLVVLFSAG